MDEKTKTQKALYKINIALGLAEEPYTEATTTESTTEETQKFVDATLSDGTLLQIEPSIEVGAVVAVQTDSGFVPIPDDTYELASGEVITTVAGVITEVVPVADATASTDTTAAAEEVAAVDEEAKIKKIIESVEKHFAENMASLKAENEALKAEFKAYQDKTAINGKELFKAISELVAEPKNEPVVKRVNPLKRERKMDGILAVSKILNKN